MLRIVLLQAERLTEWSRIERPLTSTLTEVECLRALDRRSLRGLLSTKQHAERRGLLLQLLENMERIEITAAVLRRAADAFPTPLRVLDAIHLATALQWAAAFDRRPVLATHDVELGTAGRAMGFTVLGV